MQNVLHHDNLLYRTCYVDCLRMRTHPCDPVVYHEHIGVMRISERSYTNMVHNHFAVVCTDTVTTTFFYPDEVLVYRTTDGQV